MAARSMPASKNNNATPSKETIMAKFIAMRPFANVKRLNFTVGKTVPDLVAKGDEFEIGATDDLAALTPEDQTKVRYVLTHNMAICTTDKANDGRVGTLRKQVVAEQARAKSDADAAAKAAGAK